MVWSVTKEGPSETAMQRFFECLPKETQRELIDLGIARRSAKVREMMADQ